MFDVITIGTATYDVFLQSSGFAVQKNTGGAFECLPLGKKIAVEKIVFSSGGGATNAAVTFAQQGLNTACISLVGDDGNGHAVLADLAGAGVDTSLCKIYSGLTAYSTILVDSAGERTILSYKGEGEQFTIDNVPLERINARWLFISAFGGDFALLSALVERAAAQGIKLVGNLGDKELALGMDQLVPLLKNFAVLSMNKEEGKTLTNLATNDPLAIIKQLKTVIPSVVALTDAHNGVLVADEAGQLYSAGVPDSPVVERTGAGDAFASGLVAEYMRNGDLSKAIQFGIANASAVVAQFGAKAGILKKGDPEKSSSGDHGAGWGPWPLVEIQPIK